MLDPQAIVRSLLAASVAALLACTPAGSPEADDSSAQEETASAEERERLSPHESVSGTVGEANITVTYGRPYKKEREIYGGLVPYGEVWRTGADEATTIESDRDLMLGALHVPAGKYALFTIPNESNWTLVVNKVSDQWGAFNHDPAEDLGRVEMAVSEASELTEQLTIGIDAGEGPNGTLSITWDMTVATLAIMAH